MSIVTRARAAWRYLAHRHTADRDLDEELASYVALLAEEKLRAGMAPEVARRAALVDAGGVEQIKERVRDRRDVSVLDALVRDVRYGLRTLIRSPVFTLAATIALALGIGANAVIFSVVNAVLLRPLAYANPDRLTVILHYGSGPVSAPNYRDWRAQSRSFSSMGAAEYWTPNLTGDRPEKLWALHVTPNIFPMLGVAPMLGRTLGARENAPGADHEIVISYALWQRHFAGDAHAVGQTLTLNGEVYTVVGVMPRGFGFAPFWATRTELWAPLVLDGATDRASSSLRVFARLAPGVTLAQARAELAAITARLDRQYPGTNRDITLQALKDKVVGRVRPALLVELGAVGLVLLIACANVAHMLLARASARQKEFALRTALGASRARIVRQLLTESVVLGTLGGCAGLVLAAGVMRALVALNPGSIPRLDTVSLDARVVAFLVAISLLTGVAFGLAPALQISRHGPGDAIKEGGRGSVEGSRGNRLRSLLMASEFALALMLLVGAGLMMRSVFALQRLDPGFDPHHVLTMVVPVGGTKEAGPEARTAFFTQLVQRVGALPGVVSASAINHLPLAGDVWGRSLRIEGRPAPAPGDAPSAVYRVVFPGYFRAMRIPIVSGRGVLETDDIGAPPVVVVNQRLAQRLFPGENPIGKRIALTDTPDVWLTIVGVTRNVVQGDWAAPPQEEIYLPYLQNRDYLDAPESRYAYQTLVIRTAGPASALAPLVRRTIASLDQSVPVAEVQTMDDVIEQATAQPRFNLFLLGAFAGVALGLAAVGIYGVMSYSVSRRTHEIGLRMALGARPRDVRRLVVRQAMVVALSGAGAGLLGAFALSRLMSSLLFGVRASDPATFAATSLALAGVALVASYIPAWRATRIDPLVALRHE